MYKKQSEERRGAGTPWYKGGHVRKDGYKLLSIWENDKKRTVLEHTYVMEQHIGRRLARNEDVHHRDGDKLNNEISNLMLLTKKAHTALHFELLEATGYWNGRPD